MGQYIEKHNLPKLTQEHPTSPVYIKNIGSVINNFPEQKAQMGSLVNCTEH